MPWSVSAAWRACCGNWFSNFKENANAGETVGRRYGNPDGTGCGKWNFPYGKGETGSNGEQGFHADGIGQAVIANYGGHY